MDGYCECGCGQKTPLAKQTRTERGQILGQPLRFINGHNSKKEGNPRWNGGRVKGKAYYLIMLEDGTYIREHIHIVEKVLGKKLPPGAEVHHLNEDPFDNTPSNLVVCPDRAYHMLLHMRTRAYKACGNPNWRPCRWCKQYDDPKNMTESRRKVRKTSDFYHAECMRNHFRKKEVMPL